MREILFRAKRKDNGQWVYGYYAVWTYETGLLSDPDQPRDKTGHFILPAKEDNMQREEDEWVEVIKETAGQYTDRKDKNGTGIYEDDILKVRLGTQGYGKNAKYKDVFMPVEWNEHQAEFTVIYPRNYGNYRFMDSNWNVHEVVGNKFDNPELLDAAKAGVTNK